MHTRHRSFLPRSLFARTTIAFAALAAIAIPASFIYAKPLNYVSDLISTSAPGVGASHIIQFTVTNPIPPGGMIVITPEAGAFTIPSDLDYTSMEFSDSTGGGDYIDRDIAAAPDTDNDGIAVVTGTSGSIAITLNSSVGIAAGDKLRLSIGVSGGETIVNPDFVRSYHIYVATEDEGGAPIDDASTLIAVVNPVALDLPTDLLRPTPFDGLPSGEIAANNPIIELSLETEDKADCRYATSTGVAYSAMTNSFTNSGGTLFFTTVSGFVNNTTYNFYVRCINDFGNPNDTDYDISFFLDPDPISNTSIGDNTGSSSVPVDQAPVNLGAGGIGNVPDGSAYLYLATVTFSGWAIPLSTVTILKDGAAGATAQAAADGTFTSTLTGLERGTYSFSAYASDSSGDKTASYGSTLTIGQATNNSISNIVIPPTIALSKDTINPGDPEQASGFGIPSTPVQITVQPQSGTQSSAVTIMATSSATGAWQAAIDSSKFSLGTYAVSARSIQSAQSESGLSTPLILTVGNGGGSCSASTDLNGDKLVNLVDFSIFLTFWDGTGPRGDFNCDQKVNLADFSILLFNWTG